MYIFVTIVSLQITQEVEIIFRNAMFDIFAEFSAIFSAIEYNILDFVLNSKKQTTLEYLEFNIYKENLKCCKLNE